MMLKLGRIAIVSAAVLTLAAAAIPTKAEAADLPHLRVPAIPVLLSPRGRLLPSRCSAASRCRQLCFVLQQHARQAPRPPLLR